VLDLVREHEDNSFRTTSQGPLIVTSPVELTSSIARNIEAALQGTTETEVQVLLTSVQKLRRLATDNILSNKILALASSLLFGAQQRHSFAGGYWRSTRISSDTVLLSIAIEPGVLLSGGAIENIIDFHRTRSTEHQINIEVPSLERFVAEMKVGRGSLYLSDVSQNASKIIDIVSASGKIQRTEINNVACLLSFSNSRVELLAELTTYLKLNTSHLESLSKSSRADKTLRIIDSLLYLIFELTDKHSLPALSTNITSTIGLLKNKGLQPVIFSRALRQSFLKGRDLVECLPMLVDVMEATETDDAAGFLIFIGLLGVSRKQVESDSNNGLFRNLFRISPKGLVLLARDLRRTNAPKPNKFIICHSQATSWLNQFHDSKPDRQTSLAKCLVLHYIKSFGAQTINWVKRNHLRLGLEECDVVSVTALAGFDVPFVIDINKRLFEDGFIFKFTSPSKCRSISDYFEENLVAWKNIRENTGFRSDIAHPPLVTVVFTTYNPVIKLFSLSLQSILHQNYPALEVIIIDDHSSIDFKDSLKSLIDDLRLSHSRSVVYKRNERNVGQYASRNIAIEMAKGEFVAIQDDDDLSHPERLNKQIVPMLVNSALMATHSLHVRVSENARFMSDGDALGEILGDAPVSFVWRKRVFNEIGSFLPTRTRGDIEFRTRLRRQYGKDSILTVSHPLVIMLGGMETISSDKEYYYRSALSALRYMMTRIPSGTVNSGGMERYIPSLLQ